MTPRVLLALVALLAVPAAGAQHVVRGTVTDAETGEPIPGANVLVVGTTTGGITRSTGQYEVAAPSPSDTLQFSFLGYVTQRVAIGGRDVIDVALATDAQELDDVVVIGYGTAAARDVTGAISSVEAADLNPVATLSVNQMLQGKAPGLQLQTRSAQPGGGVTANVRGATSPNGSNQPLYVIDGVPITEFGSSVPSINDDDVGFYGGIDRDPLSALNPSDIESVTVLKDASAAAIYGSAAANGVVLITTKGGRAGDLRVDYRGGATFETIDRYVPLLDAGQFMRQQDRLAYDRYLFENRIAPYGTTNPGSVAPYAPLFTEADMAGAASGTDWLDLVTRDGFAQEHNVAISGGSPASRAYVSFNYRGTDAVLENSTLDRITGRVNLDQTLSSAVRLRLRMSGSQLSGSNASTGANDGGQEKYNMLQAAYAYAPTVPVYEDDGTTYAYTYNRLIMNPAAFLIIDDQSSTTSLFATPSLEVDLAPGVTATVSGQFSRNASTRGFYLPRRANNAQLPDGMAQRSEGTIDNYSTEAYVNLDRRVGPASVSAVVGGGFYRAETEGFSAQGVGFFTDAFSFDNLGVAESLEQNVIGSYKSGRNKLSQFTRVNLSIADRYLVSLVGRFDGSSVFAENKKVGFFPGLSVGWVASDEAFLAGVPALSRLKVRAGVGQAGNESILVGGNALQLYSPGYPTLIGNRYINGVALSQVANPDLSWETVTTLNLGLDFALFNYRVTGSADYFVKTASDLLDFQTLPANNAVGLVAANIGSTRSQGVELALGTQNVAGDRVSWRTDLTLSRFRSRWVERNPAVALAPYVGETDELGTIYGWETDGIIQTEADRPSHMPDANLGNVRYVDQNGDGALDENDVVVLGNAVPRWTLGLGNTVAVGAFDLNVFVYGNLGYKRANTFAPNVFNLSQSQNPENTTALATEVWSSQNPDGTLPGVATNPYDQSNPAGDDFYLEDASFLRLNNVTLGYRLPERFIQGLVGAGRSARLYLDVQNLGVITSYSGFDPEFTEVNPYPNAYSTTLGVELGL